jgi:hypothetical protein
MFLPSRMMPTSEGIGQTASLSWDYQKLEVDDIAEKVSKRELFVHFYGRIKYRDMFGGNWAYTFRFWWMIGIFGGGKWIGGGQESSQSETPDQWPPN